MSCTRPLAMYHGPGETVVFDSKHGYEDRKLSVKCGSCPSCQLARSRDWGIRCSHEARTHEKSCVLTLTYRQESLPASMSVNVQHWQKFAKRLRKAKGPFRFLHCGEYGDENKRPHYHAVIFGLDFSEDRVWYKDSAAGYPQYVSSSLQKLWTKGLPTIGDVSFESAAYVAGYALKKTLQDTPKALERFNSVTGETWSVKKPYITMSRNKGLGTAWYERFRSDIFPCDQVVIKGRTFPVPKFYDRLLEIDDPKMYAEVVTRRRRKSETAAHAKHTTPERLRVREKYAEMRIGEKNRDFESFEQMVDRASVDRPNRRHT